MLGRVQQRAAAHNNDSAISRSPILTAVKVLYYRLFARLYSWVGAFSDVVMVRFLHGHAQPGACAPTTLTP